MHPRFRKKRIFLTPFLGLIIISAVSMWMKFTLKPISNEYHGIRALQFAQPSSVRFRGFDRPLHLKNETEGQVEDNSSK